MDELLLNNELMYQAFCLQIGSEQDLCDPLVGDENKTYEEEIGKIFEMNGLKWFVVFRDEYANMPRPIEPLDFELISEIKVKYGAKFKQYKDIIKEGETDATNEM